MKNEVTVIERLLGECARRSLASFVTGASVPVTTILECLGVDPLGVAWLDHIGDQARRQAIAEARESGT